MPAPGADGRQWVCIPDDSGHNQERGRTTDDDEAPRLENGSEGPAEVDVDVVGEDEEGGRRGGGLIFVEGDKQRHL